MTRVTRTIGGFFGLELPTAVGALPPPDAVCLHSGRACLRAILDIERPRRLLAPFYLCDAAFVAARALGIPVAHYPVDEHLHPTLPPISDNDCVMVVDYFGLCGEVGRDLATLGHRLVVDQTHALFADGPTGSWRFTSVRKWFGVPDGGFLWGPRLPLALPPASLLSIPVHLVERVWGDPTRAYQAYQTAEAGFGVEAEPISAATVALLGGVDTALVKAARRRNYLRLQDRLGRDNALDLTLAEDAVPFCYPMLPHGEVSREALAKGGIFVPTFWADCLNRPDSAFAWEMDLARRLLPLPVDHRYNVQDMDHVADQVLRQTQK
jgi:hypothetical protein